MTNILETSAERWEADVLQAEGAILVDFWAEWCGPCKMMEPLLAELAERHSGSLKIAKIDVQSFPDIAMRYGVMNLPTLVLFSDGEPKEHIAGYMPLKVLEGQLSGYL